MFPRVVSQTNHHTRITLGERDERGYLVVLLVLFVNVLPSVRYILIDGLYRRVSREETRVLRYSPTFS